MSARSPDAADAVLERLLMLLPLAARDGGARIDELAEKLGVDSRRILRDLEELRGRNYYLPPERGTEIQLEIGPDELTVWTTGGFQRPVRLSSQEALALELALRITAPEVETADRPAFEELRARLVEALRVPSGESEPAPAVSLGGAENPDDSVRGELAAAAREHREVTIVYLAPGKEPDARRVHPLLLVHAEGRWYLLARGADDEVHRAFRLDRILEVEPGRTRFSRTEADEAALERFLHDGRVHDGGTATGAEPFEAVVEYSERIARWIREKRWPATEDIDGGGLRVRHRVVDPGWLVRHVLGYGTEARLVAPEWARARLVEVLRDRIPHDPPASH